jgi:hypothetical protein
MPRRFPPPWSIEEGAACFIVRDHDKQVLAYVYYENESGRRSSAASCTAEKSRPSLWLTRFEGRRRVFECELGLSRCGKGLFVISPMQLELSCWSISARHSGIQAR